jgi:hypothetical protein
MLTDSPLTLAEPTFPPLYQVRPDGTLEFNPHEGQARVWLSLARFILMLAGTQGGKTSFGPIWLWREITRTADIRGGNDYLAITTSYPLFALKMLPEMRKWFEYTLGIARYWNGPRVLELKDPRTGTYWARTAADLMWGRIILLSVGSGGGLEAATAKAVWLDEVGQDEWDILDWEAVLRRLSLARGRVLGTTTVYNMGWTKTEWYDKWADGNKEYDVVQFDSVENPAFPREEFEAAATRLPDWRYEMFYRGRYAKPAGLIYNVFDEALLAEDVDHPQEWDRMVTFDFGGANQVMLWWVLSPAGVWTVYDEYHGGGKSTAEHATYVKERDLPFRELKVIQYVGGAGSEGQQRRDWSAEGVPIEEPPDVGVEPGIDRVIELFKTGRLKIARRCKGLRHELATYRRKLGDDGQPTEEIMDKRKFHRLDALRYGAAKIIGKGDARVWRY